MQGHCACWEGGQALEETLEDHLRQGPKLWGLIKSREEVGAIALGSRGGKALTVDQEEFTLFAFYKKQTNKKTPLCLKMCPTLDNLKRDSEMTSPEEQ
jgi:hypothetical protein